MADVAVRVHTIHPSHGYVVVNGKYQVVAMRRRYAIRDVTTGEHVEVFWSHERAWRRAQYLNKLAQA